MQHYSLTLKHLCRGDEAVSAAVEAISTLEPLGETPELARAYATLAALRMTRNENDEAIELARRAAALARSLGTSDVIADALNTEGCAVSATDPSWVELIRRSLELAISRNLPNQAGRAYSNLYGISCDQFRFDEGEQYYRDGIAYCEHTTWTSTPISCARPEPSSSNIADAGTKRWRSVLCCWRRAQPPR